MPIFFLHLRTDLERVHILYVWLSAKYSYTRRLRVRIESRLVRHVVTYSNTFCSRTYSYNLLDASMIHVRMASCDVYLYTPSRPYFFTAGSFLCAYGSLRHIHILYFTYVFLHCPFLLCTYFPSRVLFLRCVFSRFFVLSRHRHRCFPFFFFALELTPDFLFYLRLLLPFPSSLKRGGGLQRFLSSTCCVVRSDEFPLHEFFFSDTVSFLIPRTTRGKSSSCFFCYSFPGAFRKLLVVRFFLITSLGILKDLRSFSRFFLCCCWFLCFFPPQICLCETGRAPAHCLLVFLDFFSPSI
jgi:hypothetical protein